MINRTKISKDQKRLMIIIVFSKIDVLNNAFSRFTFKCFFKKKKTLLVKKFQRIFVKENTYGQNAKHLKKKKKIKKRIQILERPKRNLCLHK